MDVASHFVSCESKRGKIISACDLDFFPTLVRKVETAQMMIGVRAHKRFENLHLHQVRVQRLLRQPVRVLLALVGFPVDCCNTAGKVPQLLCYGPGYKQYKPLLSRYTYIFIVSARD